MKIKESNLSNHDMINTAWASAATLEFQTEEVKANGGRISLKPQLNWESNNQEQLKKIIQIYKDIQLSFNKKSNSKISIADLIILGGCVAIEDASIKAGKPITVPFVPGRTDALQEQTDIKGMSVLEPIADGFRNYKKADFTLSSEELLIDKAQQLTLTAPEMTALVGGMSNSNYDNSNVGILTETLSS